MDIDQSAQAAPDVQSTGDTAPVETAAPQTTDIDSISEFSFQGQKFTPQALAKLLQEHKTYSQSLEETKKYRDYADNIEIDIERVVKDPSLAEAFKKVYPKQYHAVVDRLIGARPDASKENAQSSLPRDVQDRIDRLEAKLSEYDVQTERTRVAESEAYLQKVVDPLFAKYPYADTKAARNAVFVEAEAMMNHGYKMTDAAWDRIVKETHLAIKKQADTLRQSELKTQLDKGKEGKDAGSGGAPAGQAPAKARTWNEATMEALRQIKAL